MRTNDEFAGHRHVRLEELILEELRGLFRDDVSDPALAGVRVVSLKVSVDYRHARVHVVSVKGAAPVLPATLEDRLRRVTPFLRARLGEAIDMKRVPDLTFVYDGETPGDDA